MNNNGNQNFGQNFGPNSGVPQNVGFVQNITGSQGGANVGQNLTNGQNVGQNATSAQSPAQSNRGGHNGGGGSQRNRGGHSGGSSGVNNNQASGANTNANHFGQQQNQLGGMPTNPLLASQLQHGFRIIPKCAICLTTGAFCTHCAKCGEDGHKMKECTKN